MIAFIIKLLFQYIPIIIHKYCGFNSVWLYISHTLLNPQYLNTNLMFNKLIARFIIRFIIR